jgi:hypothetical protein
MMDGLPELARRLAELDAEPGAADLDALAAQSLARRLAELDAEPDPPQRAAPSVSVTSVDRAELHAGSGELKLVYGKEPGPDFIWAYVPDKRDIPQVAGGPCVDIDHFITVVGRIHDTRITGTNDTSDVHILPCVSAAAADALLKNCRLLARLEDAVPEIVTGPLRFDFQYWVGIENPSHAPKRELTLSESHFIGVSDAAPMKASTKPFYVGLFTSTGVLGTYGMWRIYLDLHAYSTLNPRPWHTWAVELHDNVVVHEIASASQWVEFVLSHPRREGELLFPDWSSVARQCDGVHMTLRAIAATQGLYFPTEQGIIAAPYWDIESTLWLRWCFRSVRLVETVI